MGDVEGMVLEEFQNIMLSVYIFVDYFFLNSLQKSTDRIFRLDASFAGCQWSHSINIIY